jgi:hypothetical protein
LVQASDEELKDLKRQMDVTFEQNVVRPGDEQYVYNLQKEFIPSIGADNDWDE